MDFKNAIKSYEDMKDSIIDLNSARIDMIEEGLAEESEAYQELIELKKEELDAERDLYDFKKQTEEQTKNIASLQRRIASLSGSDNAADIAERRRLQKELEDAQSDYEDSLYNHSKDAQSKALDDEMESYNKANEDYIEQLRDKLDDVDAMIAETLQQVLANADIVLGTLNELSAEHGVALSTNITDPWEQGKNAAIAFKEQIAEDLNFLTNEDGVVIGAGTTIQTTFETAFGAASMACNGFKTTVDGDISAIKQAVESAASSTEAQLKLPWKNMTGDDSPINTFSQKVSEALNKAKTNAQTKAQTMTNALADPYKSMMGENGTLATFNKSVVNTHDKWVSDARTTVTELNNEYSKVKTPSYTTPTDTVTGGGGGGGGGGDDNTSSFSAEDVKNLQVVLNRVWYRNLKLTGKYDQDTKDAVAYVQKQLNIKPDGLYGATTRHKMYDEINRRLKQTLQEAGLAGNNPNLKAHADTYSSYIKRLPPAFFAKGTMGTSSNQWAITDEPQYGDELVLIPTKEGNLSYMRKGTSVIPADITENLVKWGQMNPDMSQMANAAHGVNVMTNVVNKPTVDIAFDSLLHVDNCSQDAIPQVKKMINEQLENFARKLNYNLKKVGAT